MQFMLLLLHLVRLPLAECLATLARFAQVRSPLPLLVLPSLCRQTLFVVILLALHVCALGQRMIQIVATVHLDDILLLVADRSHLASRGVHLTVYFPNL